MDPILLSEWSGDGVGHEYTWTKNNKSVICEYIEDEHLLQIKYQENEITKISEEENLNIDKKPSVFTMRKTSERLVNDKIK